MKKIIRLLSLICCFLLLSNINAFAYIESSSNIDDAVSKLTPLANTNYRGYMNRAEIIGLTQDNFNLTTADYQNKINNAIRSLRKIQQNVEEIDKSPEFSDSEKKDKINSLYKEADDILYEIPTETTDYLYKLRTVLPTITYQRFKRQFTNFYNNIGIEGRI